MTTRNNGIPDGQYPGMGGTLEYGEEGLPDPFATASISTDGAGGATLENGEGVDSVSIVGTRVQVTLSQPQPNAFWKSDIQQESVAAADPADVAYGSSARTRTTVLVGAITGSTGAALDLSANAVRFQLTAFRSPS